MISSLVVPAKFKKLQHLRLQSFVRASCKSNSCPGEHGKLSTTFGAWAEKGYLAFYG